MSGQTGTKIGITVLVASYNGAKFLRETLRQVFAQDYDGPMQVVIIDDASKDESCDVIRQAIADFGQGKDVSFVINEQNSRTPGYVPPKRPGLFKYDWIVTVDQDDVQMPDRVRKVAEAVEKYPGISQVMFSRRDMDAQGKLYGYRSYGCIPYEDAPEELYLGTPKERADCWLGRGRGRTFVAYGCAAAYRRDIFAKWGTLNPLEDHKNSIGDAMREFRNMLECPVYGSKYVAIYYRSHDGNMYNRQWTWDWKGYIEHEKFWAKNQIWALDTAYTMLHDLKRAKENGWTDWSEDDLYAAEQKLHTEIAECEMRLNWWQVSWFERVRRAFHYRGKVSPLLSKWAWYRLLPLWLVAWLRYRKHEK